jgi:tripartite-type tricarboxylate transporter receptor subunit TctC
MKILRRRFLQLGGAFTALSLSGFATRAQTYPSRAVRMIVGFAAGGPTDIVARLIGQRMSERLGQPFIIENRPGAAGNIATEAALKSKPDGHTLLFVSASNAVNISLYDRLGFDFIRDFAPIAGIVSSPFVMIINPSIPVRTVPEFIAYAKENPNKLNFASGGNGSSQHLAGELFKMMAGINMVHIPYRGAAPALSDLIGGQVQVMFDNLVSSIGHIRAGKLRALALTSTTRSPALPDVPSISDTLAGYGATAWVGLGAPRNTPAAIVETLNAEINRALADPKIKAQLSESGGAVFGGSPADFARFIGVEAERWAKVIKFANIRSN